jgi:hypothetical protein
MFGGQNQMSRSLTRIIALVAIFCMLFSVEAFAGKGSGHKKQGFFAKIGAKIKHASQKVGHAVKTAAKKTGKAIKKAAKKTGQAIKTTAKKPVRQSKKLQLKPVRK